MVDGGGGWKGVRENTGGGGGGLSRRRSESNGREQLYPDPSVSGQSSEEKGE